MKIISIKNKRASAIMLVLFILSGIMIIVFGGSSVIISGLKMSSVQSQSTLAYFTAEAGAERLLYEFRKTPLFSTLGSSTPPVQENIFGTYSVPEAGEYIVNYNSYNPLIFTSIGSYQRTRRSVEVTFY